MLEPKLVEDTVRLPGTAVGMIMEDHAEAALTVADTDRPADSRATTLRRAGEDIALLAGAMEVLLQRRCGLDEDLVRHVPER